MSRPSNSQPSHAAAPDFHWLRVRPRRLVASGFACGPRVGGAGAGATGAGAALVGGVPAAVLVMRDVLLCLSRASGSDRTGLVAYPSVARATSPWARSEHR